MCLGSNVGDPAENINEALSRLEVYGDDIRLKAMSELYQTEPQGLKDQPWFTNQVVHLEVDPEIWACEGLLSTFQAIEGQMGRDRDEEEPGGPRVIDIDLLLFGDRTMEDEFLTLPHPRMHERAFVLVPLKEIAPGLTFPNGETIDQALSRVQYRTEDKKIWQD